MKRFTALIVVATVAAWVVAEEPSRPQPQNPPATVPRGRPLPGKEGWNHDLIDDRPGAREKLEARQRERAPDRPAQRRAAPKPDELPEETDAQAWKAIRVEFEKPGELKDNVFRFVFPRDDLDVTVEGNEVPAAAGIESEFRFWRCPCGRINVMGQFVLADYEANDVIDALRKDPDAGIRVTSVGPLLLHEKPRLIAVRFFGENRSGAALAKTLRKTLSWTGKERMAPQKVN